MQHTSITDGLGSDFPSQQLMRQCPRFERCSAPICPLDLLQDERDRSKSRTFKNGHFTPLNHNDLKIELRPFRMVVPVTTLFRRKSLKINKRVFS